MHIPQISSCTFSAFNENILPKFSPLQKKMGIIALVAFGLIAACYAFWRCLKPKKEEVKVEVNPAEIAPVDVSAEQDKAINTLTSQFVDTAKKHALPKSFQSGICVVKCDFENGSIKQQYLFKNEDGAPVIIDFATETDKIGKSLKNELQEDFGLEKGFEWFVLVKEESKKFFQIHGHHTIYSTPTASGSSLGSGSCGGAIASEKSPKILERMGIPMESLIAGDEFLKGEFYVDLNAPLPI